MSLCPIRTLLHAHLHLLFAAQGTQPAAWTARFITLEVSWVLAGQQVPVEGLELSVGSDDSMEGSLSSSVRLRMVSLCGSEW